MPESIRQVGEMKNDLVRNQFNSIYKRGLVEYTKPRYQKRKRRNIKFHKAHNQRPDYQDLDPTRNVAIKLPDKQPLLKVVDDVDAPLPKL